MENKKEKALLLLDQIIQKSIEKDCAEKTFIKTSIGFNVSDLGESWMTFHLKNLKELMIDSH